MGSTVRSLRRVLAITGLCLAALMVPQAGVSAGAHESPAGACDESDTIVAIADFAFEPATVEIPAGNTVCWTNTGAFSHTATSDTGAFDSGTLTTGQEFRFTFTIAG